MDYKKFLLLFKEKFLKFWRSENSKISLIRDVFVSLVLVLIILMSLWAYTGQWLGTPIVAIESGSMEHLDPPFGRIGTIDAGDMVLLVRVDGRKDILTNAIKSSENCQYGDYGDVIIYIPYGKQEFEDPIIHRSMCWVDYNEEYNTYSVEGYSDNQNVTRINIPELGLENWEHPNKNPYGDPVDPHSGFITKGDNKITNDKCDQVGGICTELIRPEWISGKARGELPWIGTLNLVFNDLTNQKSTVGNVHSDSLTCLIILITILISIPILMDLFSYLKEKKKKNL